MTRIISKGRLMGLLAVGVLVAAFQPVTSPDPVTLRLNLKQGDVFTVQFSTDQLITQSVMGNEMEIEQTMGYTYTNEVVAVGEGTFDVQVTYTKVNVTIDSPQGMVVYDSDNPTGDTNPMTASFSGLVDQSFTVRFNDRGEVLEVMGLETMVESMLAKMGEGMDAATMAQLSEGIQSQYSDEAMSRQMGNMFTAFPEQALSVGDTWNSEVEGLSNFPVVLSNVYTLTAVEDGVATISLDTQIVTGENATQEGPMGAEMVFSLEGEQSGTMTVDLATGWTLSSEMIQEIGGQIDMDMGGNAMEIPITLSSTITMQSKR